MVPNTGIKQNRMASMSMVHTAGSTRFISDTKTLMARSEVARKPGLRKTDGSEVNKWVLL